MIEHANLHPVNDAGALSPDETKLLGYFRATAADARVDMLLAARALAECKPRQRPALAIVHMGEGN